MLLLTLNEMQTRYLFVFVLSYVMFWLHDSSPGNGFAVLAVEIFLEPNEMIWILLLLLTVAKVMSGAAHA